MADEQISARLQALVKLIDQLPFGFTVKINHHIPAENYMKLLFKRKYRRIQIEFPENNFLP